MVARSTVTSDLPLFPFESHYVDIPSCRIHYIDESEPGPEKPVLLMLHGNPTWSFYWRNLIKAFRREYRVIAMDHVGCGFSDKPKRYPYCLSQHIRNLSSFIEKLNLKHITLLVHDWGGAIGMGYAVRAPQNIRSCVVFNTAAFPSPRIPWRISVCRTPVLGKLFVQGLNGFARAATRMATAKRMSKDVRKGYLAPYNSYANRIGTYEFVRDIPMSSSHPSWAELVAIESELPRLMEHPMILIWGGKDWVFDESFLETWKRKFPNAHVRVLPEAGHYVVEDALQEIIQILGKFLEEGGRR